MARTYIIYCDPCGYKKLVEDPMNVGLKEFGTTTVQGRTPVYNQKTKKTETFPQVTTMPKFKCPNCGRVVTLKKSNVPKSETPKNDTKENPQAE